jgi:CheY-like chemotaxis protein
MSVVLIADSNVDRAHAIADACQHAGLRARTAAHGAAALELALGEQPDALVAEVELPLIDGPRLAEILDANPRTHGMGVLFIGDGEAANAGGEGQILPGEADAETIGRFLEALMKNRRRAEPASSDPNDGGVEGQLSQIALPELLDLFHVNRRTGMVELRQTTGRRAEAGRVWICDGEIVHAEAGPVEAEKALYRLFTWRRGSFVFKPAVREDKISIERPTRALLREGCRQMEERERLADELPAPSARLSLRVSRASLPNVLHPLTQEVLLILELTDRVQSILDRSTFPDYQVLRTLQTLILRGMVSVVESTARAREKQAGVAPGLAARVRDWLDASRPQGAPLADAKIVVVGPGPDASATLGGLLERIPGIELCERSPHRIVAPLARISLDEETGIELIDLSSEPQHAPTWRFVLHGAMAVVVLHTATEAPANALQPVLELLAQRPRTRVLHLLLEEKHGMRPDALAERLGLLDPDSVVSIPIEKPQAARPAIRDLLSRAVS